MGLEFTSGRQSVDSMSDTVTTALHRPFVLCDHIGIHTGNISFANNSSGMIAFYVL